MVTKSFVFYDHFNIILIGYNIISFRYQKWRAYKVFLLCEISTLAILCRKYLITIGNNPTEIISAIPEVPNLFIIFLY